MLETDWIKCRNRWIKCIKLAKDIIFVGFLSVGVGVWFLPQLWMRLIIFGVWLIFLGLTAHQGLLGKEPK